MFIAGVNFETSRTPAVQCLQITNELSLLLITLHS
jgi:hypothetical protein